MDNKVPAFDALRFVPFGLRQEDERKSNAIVLLYEIAKGDPLLVADVVERGVKAIEEERKQAKHETTT